MGVGFPNPFLIYYTMITFDNNQKIVTTSKPIVIVKKEINIGGINVPYECRYDFSKIPEQYHGLILQVISKI